MRPIFAIAVLAAMPAPSVLADSISIEASQDASIFDNGNACGAGNLYVGRTGNFGGGVVMRSLIAFDLSGIPAGSTINSVTFTVQVTQAGPLVPTPYDFTLHRVQADWGQGASIADGGLGAPPETDDATWTNRFHPGVPWASAGGDFVATASSTLNMNNVVGPKTWPSTPELVADVQAWLDGTADNNGWLMKGDETVLGVARRMNSSEDPTGFRPVIDVDYTPGGGGDPCPGDTDGSGTVDFNDLVELLAAWGPCSGCSADFDNSGVVDFDDLIALLAAWGPCS